MNYRHVYHAGNFADVMKHLALTLVLEHFKKKDTPFCVIDAHGGCGLYDLQGEQAQKTGEWEAGIGKFVGLPDIPEDFKIYNDLITHDLKAGRYPGSPLISARLIRDSDRMIANELHPDDVETLQFTLRHFKNVRVSHMDAYECIRAHVPPTEKRGVVLIDPPFEKRDEFQTLIRQMKEWKKRFPTGCYILWYPIKAHLAVDEMKQAAKELGLARTWCLETMLYPREQPETFNGSGLIIFNAPYQIPQRLKALMPFLTYNMGLFDTPDEWLTPE
jgi:23S rRNA (adenine2030-N6)-methyltransferase